MTGPPRRCFLAEPRCRSEIRRPPRTRSSLLALARLSLPRPLSLSREVAERPNPSFASATPLPPSRASPDESKNTEGCAWTPATSSWSRACWEGPSRREIDVPFFGTAWTSSTIAAASSRPVPRRHLHRLRGEHAVLLDPFSFSFVHGIVDTVPFSPPVDVRYLAAAPLLISSSPVTIRWRLHPSMVRLEPPRRTSQER